MIDTSHGVWSTLKNGLRGKCPHCGQAGLFEGWVSVRHACPVCGLVFERNPGDTWAFWIVGDRFPIAAAIVVLYFGFRPHTWLQAIVFGGALAMALIGTIPHRQGFVIALDYLSRRWWPDPADVLPSAPILSAVNSGQPAPHVRDWSTSSATRTQ
jgi:uncharacterized protein (DUF983 family)